ncbi:hypothetical protein LCGC14_2096930 [marine sediment metagenome]|uniref:Uncharacterized protein n=1 Tax=marine sediment metagenome TaxID=412755 RepID=A0A0F9EB00_9ZZZZ
MNVEELQAYVDEKFPELKLRVYPCNHQPSEVSVAIGDLTYNVALNRQENVRIIRDRLVSALRDTICLLNSQIVQVKIAQQEPTEILGVKVYLVGAEYWADVIGAEYWADVIGYETLWNRVGPERIDGKICYDGIPIVHKLELDSREVSHES